MSLLAVMKLQQKPLSEIQELKQLNIEAIAEKLCDPSNSNCKSIDYLLYK